jgi:chromosome segregation ATPase
MSYETVTTKGWASEGEGGEKSIFEDVKDLVLKQLPAVMTKLLEQLDGFRKNIANETKGRAQAEAQRDEAKEQATKFENELANETKRRVQAEAQRDEAKEQAKKAAAADAATKSESEEEWKSVCMALFEGFQVFMKTFVQQFAELSAQLAKLNSNMENSTNSTSSTNSTTTQETNSTEDEEPSR